VDPGKPWIEIPPWFHDSEPVPNNGAPCACAVIQDYFGCTISRRAVEKFLFGDSLKGVTVVDLRSPGYPGTCATGSLTLEAGIRLPNGNGGTIRHTFNRDDRTVSFDYIKPEKAGDRFPKGFGREFFRHFIPALRELGISRIEIQASSSPSAGMNGAYTWCFYGFTNRNMKETLQRYILYLEDYHGIFLDGRQRNVIMKIERMKRLAELELNSRKFAKEFLLGIGRGTESWNGLIQNIGDENTIEMCELTRYLSGVK